MGIENIEKHWIMLLLLLLVPGPLRPYVFYVGPISKYKKAFASEKWTSNRKRSEKEKSSKCRSGRLVCPMVLTGKAGVDKKS